ncbi:helix-turn-helix domain-containing protein [Microbacterium sp.]|uniref:helix-turn-helix domain-containing protein n=1 Tax=Microbacterium sp. TaxID=51671 RepID=UPI0039E53255
MDRRADVREFLQSRRDRLTPDRAGLPAYGGNRRVPGLRREEVALLAGVSVDYYTRLERGDLSGVSDAVLGALARALQLDDAETAHLFDLARAAHASPLAPRTAPRRDGLRPGIQRLLEAIDAPATVIDGHHYYVGANRLGRALYAPVFAEAVPNSARFLFLNPAAHDFYPQWDQVASELVAALRGEAGRSPYDKRLTDLVGELSTRSEPFRTLWAAHDVRHHRTGVKHIRHPHVGDLVLTYEALELPADPGLRLSVFTAEPGSTSADALTLLGALSIDAASPVAGDAAGLTR